MMKIAASSESWARHVSKGARLGRQNLGFKPIKVGPRHPLLGQPQSGLFARSKRVNLGESRVKILFLDKSEEAS
ncbi:MAG TPA: hypothetical protein VE133_03910, partial [Candidatus Sulfotelmatobacter sp.]|nr:hypothetical protein [Candidatus Sulfotelmatobacter sp.]